MKNHLMLLIGLNMIGLCGCSLTSDSRSPQFRKLFNDRDLSGWVNVNTAPDTWKISGGMMKKNRVLAKKKLYLMLRKVIKDILK